MQAVFTDPHVSDLTGNQWALTLTFLFVEIFYKPKASLGIYCKQMSERGGVKEREPACGAQEQTEKALRMRADFSRTVSELGTSS